jgi:glycerate 2-kinase
MCKLRTSKPSMIRVHTRHSLNRRLDETRRDVLNAMENALYAADPCNAIRRHVRIAHATLRVDDLAYSLKRFRRIFVIGAGKATAKMANAIENILADKITSGLVIVPDYVRPLPSGPRIMYHAGSHPIPSRKNVDGVTEMLSLVKNPLRDDLIIVLLSGGASALMDYPSKDITLEDEKRTTSLLLKSGASIQEINTVRKHISRVKGGRLAEILEPAHVLTLIISDVIGNEIDAIGSGPTAPDPTTYHDARQILTKYELWSRIPAHVQRIIDTGNRGSLLETPKPGDSSFRRVRNVIVGNNRESCQAATAEMTRAGYESRILSTRLVGEAREVGRILGSIMTETRDNYTKSRPAALITGGETTVTVKGGGKGGRNQELALAAALEIEGCKGIVIGSLATDGVDGPTDAAGALVDGTTISRGRRRGMEPQDYLDDNNSYSYFSRLGDLIRTGPTGTNVNDIMILSAN